MIARLWRGHTRSEDADAYQRVLQATGVRDYRATPGNLGVWMLRHEGIGRTEFLLLTLWKDRASIAAFAGDDIDRARYYDADNDYLLDFHRTVEHFDVSGCWSPAEPMARAPERSRADGAVRPQPRAARAALRVALGRIAADSLSIAGW